MHKRCIFLLSVLITSMPQQELAAAQIPNQPEWMRELMHDGMQAAERAARHAQRQREQAERDRADLARQAATRGDLNPQQLEQLNRMNRERDRWDNLEAQAGQMVIGAYQTLAQTAIGAWEKEANKDFYNKQMEMNMATQIGKADVEAQQSSERFKHFFSESNLRNIALSTTGAIAGYFALKFAYHYAEKQLGIPSLVRETSHKSLKQQIVAFFSEEQKPLSLDEVILPQEVTDAITAIARQAQTAHDNGLPYRNVMLYGPPGTGKTMFARRLAYASGMDYALMTGADFSQFFGRNEEVQKLHELLDWAESSERGLLLFIDEADAFCRDRRLADVRAANLLNAFLARTGSRSDKLMFIFATNHPEVIDKAILSRTDTKVYFPLPSQQEREKLFWLYANKYLLQHRGKMKRRMQDGSTTVFEIAFTIDPDFNEQFLKQLAAEAEGLAGREIEQVMATAQNQVYLNPDDLRVSCELVRATLHAKIKEQKHAGSWTMAASQAQAAPAA